MSRKHYEAAAEIIRARIEDPLARRAVAMDFARMFAADNGRFDRARFLTACGVDR